MQHGVWEDFFLSLFLPLWKMNRDLRSPPSSPPTQSRCYTSRPATIFERCLSGLDQIYSYEFQKALDSSPKRSLLADAAPRNDAPKIRVLAVGLLVDAFVRLLRYPRRCAREPGIAMAPILSRQKVLNVSLRRKRLKIRTIIFSFFPRKNPKLIVYFYLLQICNSNKINFHRIF